MTEALLFILIVTVGLTAVWLLFRGIFYSGIKLLEVFKPDGRED
jgi:hypothetical protein